MGKNKWLKLGVIAFVVAFLCLYTQTAEKKPLNFDTMVGLNIAPEQLGMSDRDIGIAFAESITDTGMSQRALVKFLGQVRTDINTLRGALNGSHPTTEISFRTSSHKLFVPAFSYLIDGVGYMNTAQTLLTFAGSGAAAGRYAPYGFEVGTDHAYHVVTPTGISAGYLTSGAAVTALDAKAVAASHARIGTGIFRSLLSAFTPGTTRLTSSTLVRIIETEPQPGEIIQSTDLSLDNL